jgi:probable rRNA maturation factor
MINIQSEVYLCAVIPICRRELAGIAVRIFSGLGVDDPCLDMLITHDGRMQELNRNYLGVEGPTNVLSFPEQDGPDSDTGGQLVINIDAINRESFLYGQETCAYLMRMMTHGILHLAGYDHGQLMDDITEKLIPDAR